MRPFLLAFLVFLQTTTGGLTNGGGSTTRGSAASAGVPPSPVGTPATFTSTLSYTQTVLTTGDALVLTVGAPDGVVITASDLGGATGNLVASGQSVDASTSLSAFVFVNVTSGSHTITMTCTGSCNFPRGNSVEFTGVPTSGTIWESGSYNATGNAFVVNCNSITTSTSNEYAVAATYQDFTTFASTSGYTTVSVDAFQYFFGLVIASASTTTPTFTANQSGYNSCLTFALHHA